MIRAVTFDYWNTLVWEAPGQLVERRLVVWRELLDNAGFAVDGNRLATAHATAFAQYQAAWRANRQYVVADATTTMLAELGLTVEPDLKARLVDAFGVAGAATDLHLAPGVGECLRSLRGGGVRLGIVCDVGLTPSPTLLGHLDRWQLLGLFDAWAFSDEVGVYKPDPAIFLVALEALATEPGDAVHVGDRLRTDVDGARRLGMGTVRYTAVYDDPETGLAEADHVVDDYAGLPGALGIRRSATA